jgi:hypothetical protein
MAMNWLPYPFLLHPNNGLEAEQQGCLPCIVIFQITCINDSTIKKMNAHITTKNNYNVGSHF